ncbi:hypothetical protein [Aeromicrobium sp. CFBP 8757]|nr:hypothetical protein [Aeromicrobium sp. CFBP 8757]
MRQTVLVHESTFRTMAGLDVTAVGGALLHVRRGRCCNGEAPT